MIKQNWKIAQQEEIACWVGNKSKINSDIYQVSKRNLWKRVIQKLYRHVSEPDIQGGHILEFGCGPNGLFTLVTNNEKYICLDPLMSQYLQHFPSIREYRTSFINGMLEDFESLSTFDYIIGFNAIDHVDDINMALQRLKLLSGIETKLILSVNVHALGWMQRLLKFTYPVFDKLHKHQYTSKQYIQLFRQAGFNILDEYCLDAELKQFVQDIGEANKPVYSWRNWFSPAFWLFGCLNLLGYPRYGYQNVGGRSVYSAKCYVLSLKSNE